MLEIDLLHIEAAVGAQVGILIKQVKEDPHQTRTSIQEPGHSTTFADTLSPD